MSTPVIRTATSGDRAAIRAVEIEAFEGTGEADLVDQLVRDGDCVLELVAESAGAIVGHVLFSRLFIELAEHRFATVALAPLAVSPSHHGTGIGTALVGEAHKHLRAAGETLSVVLGDPSYYGRFGYSHARAQGFESAYQCDALQAAAWGEAPVAGRLVYATAFAAI